MPHIHAGVDFVVAAFVVHRGKVALVQHKKLRTWMPIGGHIDLDKTPDDALWQELEEEAGLVQANLTPVEPVRKWMPEAPEPSPACHNARRLIAPWAVEVHDFPPVAGHRHVALIYFLSADTPMLILSPEHHDIRWFDSDELHDPNFQIMPTIQKYGEWALMEVLHQVWRDPEPLEEK